MDNKKEQSNSQLQIRIPFSLLKRLKGVCNQKYRSVSSVVKELILKFVEENE